MIDGNQLREEFGRYLAEHKATRWGMDAALMHVCKIAYDAGKADGPGEHLNGAAATLDGLLTGRMKRSVKVEQVLQDVADGKRPVLTPDECRALSLSLGTPDHFRDAAGMVAEPAEPERRIGPASDADMAVYQSIADGYTRDTAPAPAEASGPDHEDGPDSEGFSGARPWNNHGDTAPTPAEVPMPEPVVQNYPSGKWSYHADQMRTYGDAREAAGYARGWKEKYENPWQDGYTSGYNDGVQDGIRTAALRGEVKP